VCQVQKTWFGMHHCLNLLFWMLCWLDFWSICCIVSSTCKKSVLLTFINWLLFLSLLQGSEEGSSLSNLNLNFYVFWLHVGIPTFKLCAIWLLSCCLLVLSTSIVLQYSCIHHTMLQHLSSGKNLPSPFEIYMAEHCCSWQFVWKHCWTFLRKGTFLMYEVLIHIKTAWHLLVAQWCIHT